MAERAHDLQQVVARIWSRFQQISKTFFRATGLSAIVAGLEFIRHPLGKGQDEGRKVAISRERPTAFLRSLIHVVPVGVTIWEIVLNWNTYYVGSSAYAIVYYQLGSKVHETMIQASLAAIIFSYVRHELTSGNGLPFGALFSGLQISQVSYLWSMEFWGSVGSKWLPLRRKLGMVAVVAITFILAAAAGPSSAVLLIPRLGYWPAGSTHIWLNATFDDIWSDR